jgi:hypothetical protein
MIATIFFVFALEVRSFGQPFDGVYCLLFDVSD